MTRRLVCFLLAAVGVATVLVGASPTPASAVGWTLQNHPGGSWAFYYVEPGANPQFCIGLGGRGDSPQGSVYQYARWENSAGVILVERRDYFADGRNVCGPIPTGATRVRVGLYAAGGPSGVHHGYDYLFGAAYERAFHWYCFGCWGTAPTFAQDPALSTLDQAMLRVSRAGFPGSQNAAGLSQAPAPVPVGVYELTAGRCTVRYGFLPLWDGGWVQMWSRQTNDCAWMMVTAVGAGCNFLGPTSSAAWPLNFTYLQSKAKGFVTNYVYVLASDGHTQRDAVLTLTGAIL